MSVSEKNVKRKLTDIIRSTGNGAVIAISTCFLLFVYAPTELFLTNQSSFWFTLYTMLPAVLRTFAVTVLASVLLLFFCNLISHTLYQIASAGFALLMICSYIQGTFLIFGLPGLDGLAIDWNQYQASRYKSIGLWIIMLIVFIVLIRIFHLRKFLKAAGIVSFCMALMLLVTLFTLSLSSRDSLNKDVLTATTENMFEMSEDTNFIILLLDAVDAPTLNQMIADGKMEGLEDTFEDFTYYTNTVGAYSCTKHAVPYILSGFWYENDRTYNDYLNTVFKESPVFQALENDSYRMGLYDSELNPTAEGNLDRFENMQPVRAEVTSYFRFAKLLVKLGGIKFAPYDLKPYCYAIAYNFGKIRKLPDSYDFDVFAWGDRTFYDDLQTTEITTTSEKCFRFIHLEGAHAPFCYDKDLNIVESSDYPTCIQASMTLTDSYLKKLKEAGVYDNSVIIVMADHGFNSELSDEGRTFEARQNPILFVKGVGEHHPYTTSDIPLSFSDLPASFINLMEGQSGEEAFAWTEGQQRERRYLYYDLNDGVGEKHMVEYIQTGHASDLSTLIRTGTEYYYDSRLGTP